MGFADPEVGKRWCTELGHRIGAQQLILAVALALIQKHEWISLEKRGRKICREGSGEVVCRRMEVRLNTTFSEV